ncbi:glycosyltransferase family A protein [Sinorhizobium meliloti]|uniref:glycosyltransferase family A protein n=1 Tax=Rhizobium meliloti TaxID=382 RepID=UPI000FD1ED67|nr:glycosyltransferase family A protein [Sinorhizobium meliloti]MDW9633604.1 glycosyltransferase [Sinorhizobium meliloti]RVJ90028.1 glycosyltransferase family 2 protein [Sinorhizobium meliloti]
MNITIAIPAYNSAATIERALDSALSQIFSGHYEILIVDDGSEDVTPAICLDYEFRFPEVIRYIRTDRAGVAAARNRLVSEARGEFITWLDADDEYFPYKLQTNFDALRANEGSPDLTMSMVSYYANNDRVHIGEYLNDPLKHVLHGELRAYLWSTMAHREVYAAVGKFDTMLSRGEDADFLIRFILAGGKIVPAGATPQMRYFFTLKGRSGEHAEEMLITFQQRYASHYETVGDRQKYLARRYWQIADYYRRNEQWDDMWRCRGLAVKHDWDEFFPKSLKLLSEMR